MTRRLLILIMAHGLGSLGAQQLEITNPVWFLALGDSYTIGQSVAPEERWPVQFADTLSALGFRIDEVEIVATTGWTTGNLLNALNQNPPTEDYSFVSLLIGVNNQYQGGSLSTYADQFEELLNRAILYAGGIESHVLVVSIPDYHYTPFGAGIPGISAEIDEFNAVNEQLASDYGVPYIYITDITRRGFDVPELVASDGLHPSGLMYGLWVERMVQQADLHLTSNTRDVLAETLVISMQPNPVMDEIYLRVSAPGLCTIRTMNGVVMHQAKVESLASLDVSLIPPGVYMLSIANSQGIVHSTFAKM